MKGVTWAHLSTVAGQRAPDHRVTWGSMLVCSSGAGVSSGGMVMDRLGGFRLCRRLLDTEDMLSPFLSVEAMVGRRTGGCNKEEGNGGTGAGEGSPD